MSFTPRNRGVPIMTTKPLCHWLNEGADEMTFNRVPWRRFWMLPRKHINATNPEQWYTMGSTWLSLIRAIVMTSHWIKFGVPMSSGTDEAVFF